MRVALAGGSEQPEVWVVVLRLRGHGPEVMGLWWWWALDPPGSGLVSTDHHLLTFFLLYTIKESSSEVPLFTGIISKWLGRRSKRNKLANKFPNLLNFSPKLMKR